MRAPGAGPDVFVLHVDLDGGQSGGVVGPRRGADDEKLVAARGVDPQLGSGGDGKGADVQGGPRAVGDPVPLHLHQGPDRLEEVLLRQLGDTQAAVGVVHSSGVAVRAEELDPVVRRPIGLQPLKALLGVVEDRAGRVQHQGRVGDNPGVVPALPGVVVQNKHMVGELFAKAQRPLVRRLGLGVVRWGKGDFQHNIVSSSYRGSFPAEDSSPPGQPNREGCLSAKEFHLTGR